jgi:hypothetical protein
LLNFLDRIAQGDGRKEKVLLTEAQKELEPGLANGIVL